MYSWRELSGQGQGTGHVWSWSSSLQGTGFWEWKPTVSGQANYGFALVIFERQGQVWVSHVLPPLSVAAGFLELQPEFLGVSLLQSWVVSRGGFKWKVQRKELTDVPVWIDIGSLFLAVYTLCNTRSRLIYFFTVLMSVSISGSGQCSVVLGPHTIWNCNHPRREESVWIWMVSCSTECKDYCISVAPLLFQSGAQNVYSPKCLKRKCTSDVVRIGSTVWSCLSG